MKEIRVGILGAADIATRYALPAFASLPSVTIAGIASRDPAKAQPLAEKYRTTVESYESLLARSDIDIIYCPLPVGLQEEWAIRVAESGKHCICEKSLTYSVESAQRMIGAFKKRGLALYENFVPEFHPQHAEIVKLIDSGRIGTPKVWNGSYGYPFLPAGNIRYSAALKGGELNYCGCYTVYMARKIMRQEPVAVTCTLQFDGHEVEMSGSALLEFPNGTALMSFGFDFLYQNTYSVWGTKGLLRTNRAFALPPTFSPEVELITNDGKKESRETVPIPAVDQFAESFNYVCTAVRTGDDATREELYTRIEKQARVLEAMRVSAKELRRVTLN